MRRFFNFIPQIIVSFAVFNGYQSAFSQSVEDTSPPKSVMEKDESIRVADNSVNLIPPARRPQVEEGQNGASTRRGPVIAEQGNPATTAGVQAQPPVPAPPANRTLQPIQAAQPIQNQNNQSFRRTNPGQPQPAPVVPGANQSDYKPAVPVKPVSIQKSAPSISTQIEVPGYINLNQPAKMKIKLVNSGDSAASSVKLLATIPDHASFSGSNPTPSDVKGKVYEFHVTDIGPKQTREVVIDLVPTEKKALEIGTEVIIENVQRFTVGVREPKLKLSLQGPTEASLGQNVSHKIILENIGDGLAENIELNAAFPKNLRREKNQLNLPNIEAGQKLEIEMPSVAVEAGKTELSVSVGAQGVDSQTVKAGLQVFQPELEVSAVGPQVNFLNRDGLYTLKVDNTGSIDAVNVAVDMKIPAGMKVTTISHQAKINPTTGILTWTFDKIAAKSEQSIKLMTMASKAGQQECVFTVKSNQTKDKTIYLTTNVVARAEMNVKLQNQTGPIQVGGKVKLSVLLENTGSSAATDLKLNVELPESLSADKQDGLDVMSIGNNIQFEAAKLEPGQKREFQFVVIATQKGEHVVRTVLNTGSSERQLVSEGIVFVYEVNENRVSESLAPAVVR